MYLNYGKVIVGPAIKKKVEQSPIQNLSEKIEQTIKLSMQNCEKGQITDSSQGFQGYPISVPNCA